jgi:hypothetical protein
MRWRRQAAKSLGARRNLGSRGTGREAYLHLDRVDGVGDRQAIMAALGLLPGNTYEGARFDKTETLATRKTASHAESPG